MLNKYTLKLLPQAERYIVYELKNVTAATKLIDEISNSLIGLESTPKRCPLSDIYELQKDGYRECVIKNYVALYTIDEALKIVKVAKVFTE